MKRQTFNEINITPLTDIFLVLLIIMMVIAPILDQQGLSLVVPEYVEQSQVQNEPKILEIAVTQDNKYVIDDKIVDVNDLFSVIKDKSEIKTDGVLIQANGESNHETVVKLMDIVRNAGVQSLSIVEM